LQVFLTGAGALAIPVVAPLIFPEESVFGANQITVSGTVQLLAFCVFEVCMVLCAQPPRQASRPGRYTAFGFPVQIGPLIAAPPLISLS
jgi:hypothetical protein